MPPRDWAPDDELPPSDEFNNSVEYGEAVTERILSDFKTEKMGAEPRQTLQRRAKYFGRAYSRYEFSDSHMLSDFNLDWAIRMGAEEYSDTKAKSFIPLLRDWFFRFGWRKVELGYLFTEYDVSSDARVLISSSIPEFRDILDEADQSASLSTNTIERVLLEDVPELESTKTKVEPGKEDDEVRIPEIELAVAGVETSLDEAGWLPLEAVNTELRVWVNANRLFDELQPSLHEQTTIKQQTIHEKILSFLNSQGVEMEAGVEVNSKQVIDKFEKQLREADWNSLVLADGKFWYAEEEEYVRALEEKLDEFEEILERPVKFSDDHLVTVYRFLDGNFDGLLHYGLFEHGKLVKKAGDIKWHSEARAKLDEIIHEADMIRLSGEVYDPDEEEKDDSGEADEE